MADTVNILEGSTFVTSDRLGNIEGTPTTPHGLFALDTRFLSKWLLHVDDQQLAVLSTDTQRYYGAQFFLAPSTGTTYVDSPMSLVRRRWIDGCMREQIGLFNHTPEARDVPMRLDIDADFADLFEVKDALEKKGHLYRRVEGRNLVLGYEREGFRRETKVSVSDVPGIRVSDEGYEFDVHLEPGGSWIVEFTVEPVAEGLASQAEMTYRTMDDMEQPYHEWRKIAPRLRSDWRPLERAYERTIEDLAALRLRLPNVEESVVPAAGLPWFMSLFGRDSLLTSYQALPFLPDLARSTLELLASMQGRHMDRFRDEEPGKILHELRFGELTAFEERPHSPYFGASDSTTLWLILLDEYERWSGREDVVRRLEPEARAALEWIDKYGDRDGDGYIEYERAMESGLDNQCWKDSWDAIRFHDGRIARLPRATCELQGYAYDAKVRGARMAREFWGDEQLAQRLEQSAADLKQRFNRDFWLEDRGFFALALDADKKPVDSVTSNIGHLLWSGIVDDDKVQRCVDHLMSEEMFSGWGIRTMATNEGAYNPIGYHVGTVWPHDTSICVMGLYRYGYRREASQLSQAMIEASTYFDARLPEAFAGYPRQATRYPAEYPTACSPQAWASGTPLLLIRAMLGLEPRQALLTVSPELPPAIGELQLSSMPGRWGTVDISADAASTLMEALEHASASAPVAVRDLFTALDESGIQGFAANQVLSVGFRLGPAGDWLLGVNDGRMRVQEGFDTADCVIETSEETLLAILRGDQNARTAALAGKVRVLGDFSIAAGLSRLTAGNYRPESRAA